MNDIQRGYLIEINQVWRTIEVEIPVLRQAIAGLLSK